MIDYNHTDIKLIWIPSGLGKIKTLTCLLLKNDTYGFGDIMLFDNGKRMKSSSHLGLVNVFLDNHVENLMQCFHSQW